MVIPAAIFGRLMIAQYHQQRKIAAAKEGLAVSSRLCWSLLVSNHVSAGLC
jgi:hypothetical protein